MKAITRTSYGPPEVLSLKELKVPVPKDDEILVRVYATTINRTDCGILWGKPYLIRCFTGLTKPSSLIPGTDFAGKVEAVGKQVTLFKVGDRVWGFNDEGLASHAQYMAIRQDKAIAEIPAHFSYAQAAASPEGAHYAINFLNKVKLQPGQKVLVNGATGAIGSAAVQLLKYYDTYVVATCRTEHTEQVKNLGADRVIDYTLEDFTKDSERYHFVFDSVGKSSFGKCKPLLLPRGIYISSELGPGAENPFLGLITPLYKLLRKKRVIFPVPVNIRASIKLLMEMMAKRKFTPLIDQHYPMENISEAYWYVKSGQKVGNVIIDME